jgi:predicted Zn-dependent protease
MSDPSALTVMRDALRAGTTGAEAPRELIDLFADLARRLGPEGVADALRLVLAFHPNCAALLNTGATINFDRERWSEAADLARWAMAAGPNTSEGQMVAAAYLFRSRRLHEARHHCALAEKLAPDGAGPLFLHGRVLMALDLVEEGLFKVDEAAKRDAKFQFAARVLHLGLTAADFDRVKSDFATANTDGGK